ncbi:eukaryotic translation initiation factor 3 subunit J [Cladochytrium replicatum]|nr:eukaryotic translation initiation factor 3 subunit J [Cladochytrium replicatum]
MSDEDDWDAPPTIVPKIPVAALVPGLAASQWDDEDVDDKQVKESWDDDDEDENPKIPAKASSPAPPKKKKTLQQKLQEKKEEEERKRREAAEKAAAEDNETSEERKRRLLERQVESDMANAVDLFAGGAPEAPAASSSILDTLKPSTKEEFDQYVKAVAENVQPFEKSGLFSYFVESLARELSISLNVDDTKRIAATLTAVANEKQKALKEAPGRKKKGGVVAKKAMLKGSTGRDTTNYGDDELYDDFEDFM